MRTLRFLILIFILLFGLGCENKKIAKESRLLMDTIAEIKYVFSRNEKKAMELAFGEMERIEGIFSKFKDDSIISNINNNAAKGFVKVDEEALRLIEDSIKYSNLSDGAFDITVAPLMEVWGFAKNQSRLPSDSQIEKILPLVNYRNIQIDREGKSIYFLQPDIKIDLGGVAKGYAVDRAAEVLKKHGVGSALVNLGGNIYAFGSPPGKLFWHIGVQHPKEKGKIILTLKIRDKGVSTSGNYERFFEINGKRFCHIINPKTGMPVEGVLSATAIADSAEEADALSTGIFVMGWEKGFELVNTLEGVAAMVILEDETSKDGFTVKFSKTFQIFVL